MFLKWGSGSKAPPPKNFLKIEMILCNLPGIWVVWVGKSAF